MSGKHCAKCATTKPVLDFGKNAGRPDGLSVYCRPCTKAYMAGKSYDKDRWAERQDAERQRNRLYREANAERLNANSRANKARIRKERPDIINARNKMRKAAQRQAIPAWADMAQVRLIYSKAKELSEALGVELQVDHVVPLRSRLVCGLHTPANLQLLAADLNHAKRNWHWPDMP